MLLDCGDSSPLSFLRGHVPQPASLTFLFLASAVLAVSTWQSIKPIIPAVFSYFYPISSLREVSSDNAICRKVSGHPF
jgi:hypothetical protein